MRRCLREATCLLLVTIASGLEFPHAPTTIEPGNETTAAHSPWPQSDDLHGLWGSVASLLQGYMGKEHAATPIQHVRLLSASQRDNATNDEIAAGTVVPSQAQPQPQPQPHPHPHPHTQVGPGAENVNKRPGRVILVGNGKSMLKKKLGAKIDSYDVVGRYNYIRLKGHTPQVGKKVTLWFLGELKQPSDPQFDRSIHPERYVVPITWPATKGCKKCLPSKVARRNVERSTNKVRKKWQAAGLSKRLEIMPDAVLLDLRLKYGYTQQWPSTGLISVIYALKYYNPPITVTGFDFGSAKKKDCGWSGCTSKVLGHWFQKNYKSHTVHNMFAEGQFLRMLQKRGLIQVI